MFILRWTTAPLVAVLRAFSVFMWIYMHETNSTFCQQNLISLAYFLNCMYKIAFNTINIFKGKRQRISKTKRPHTSILLLSTLRIFIFFWNNLDELKQSNSNSMFILIIFWIHNKSWSQSNYGWWICHFNLFQITPNGFRYFWKDLYGCPSLTLG